MDDIIITGSNGMLGSSFCNNLNNEFRVHAFHRDEKSFPKCYKSYNFDLLNFNSLKENIKKIDPKIIFHCASLTNLEYCEINLKEAMMVNVEITEKISQFANKDTLIIYISTDQVYGEIKNKKESINNYGITKYLGEKKISNNSDNYIIIRTNIIGSNMKPNKVSFAEWIYNSLSNYIKVNLFSDYLFSPVHTNMLIKNCLELYENKFNGIINIGSSDSCSKYDFGLKIAEANSFDKDLIKEDSISNHNFLAGRANDLRLNVSLAKRNNLEIHTWNQSINNFLKRRKKE